jgi:hypothetical protein
MLGNSRMSPSPDGPNKLKRSKLGLAGSLICGSDISIQPSFQLQEFNTTTSWWADHEADWLGKGVRTVYMAIYISTAINLDTHRHEWLY